MTETAYIFDSIRTPRGKGKQDGSLYQASPIWLVRGLLKEMQQRHHLDTSLVDDVVPVSYTHLTLPTSDLV